MPDRDPLSVHYDAATGQLLQRAAQASRFRRGVRTWIVSPSAEYRNRDSGGRTRHERAFIRSAYRLVRSPAINPDGPVWSLKLTWGEDDERKPSRPGHMARPVTARLFRRDQTGIPANSYLGHYDGPHH